MGDIVAEYQERVNKKANPVKSWLFCSRRTVLPVFPVATVT